MCVVSAQEPGTYLTFPCGISVKLNPYIPALHRNTFLSIFFFLPPYRINLMTSVELLSERGKIIWILLKVRVRDRSLHERPTQDTRRGSHLQPLLQRLHPTLRFRQVVFSPAWRFTGESLEVLASYIYSVSKVL